MLYMDGIRSSRKILGHWESGGVFCTRKAPGKSFYDWKICFTSHPSMDTKPIKLDGGTCWHIEAELDNEFRGMFVFLFPKAGWREGARGEAEMKTVTRRKAFLCLWRRQIGNIIQFWEASQILCCQSAFFRPQSREWTSLVAHETFILCRTKNSEQLARRNLEQLAETPQQFKLIQPELTAQVAIWHRFEFFPFLILFSRTFLSTFVEHNHFIIFQFVLTSFSGFPNFFHSFCCF